MKTKDNSIVFFMFLLLAMTLLLSCEKDDDPEDTNEVIDIPEGAAQRTPVLESRVGNIMYFTS